MLWKMSALHITSISDPFLSARSAWLGLQLVTRARTMGFLPPGIHGPVQLNGALLDGMKTCLSAVGLASAATLQLDHAETPEQLEAALEHTIEAVDASPNPAGEWGPGRELLGDDLLGRLVGDISPASLRRYASGERATPDEVAWRLHVVARLLAALLGSYNEYGIRRWFERPRAALGSRTPAQVLEAAENEDDAPLGAVIALAERLRGAGAAA